MIVRQHTDPLFILLFFLATAFAESPKFHTFGNAPAFHLVSTRFLFDESKVKLVGPRMISERDKRVKNQSFLSTPAPIHSGRNYPKLLPTAMSLNSDDDSNPREKRTSGDLDESKKKTISVARAGGRFRSQVGESKKKGWLTMVVKKWLPVVVILLILKNLLFGYVLNESNDNFVYYESTVVERTSYNSEGEKVKIRKERVQSNAPNFKDADLLRQSSLDDLDDEIEWELDVIGRSAYRDSMQIDNILY